MFDPVSHIVYVAHGDDVRSVMVNGKFLMRDRKMLTLDEARVLADARAVISSTFVPTVLNGDHPCSQ